MSIRLLQSIFVAGVLSPVDGSTLSLSAALEADLVNQGKAVWVAAPELTASELAHASAHARMRQPNGVPIILAQSAIPMMLQSSGTMGANGALTGLTALPYSVFPQPCFMYFPAGKVYSGSPAGMYFASILTPTTATVYNDRYSSGLPQNAIPAIPTAVADAGPGAYTQATTEIALISVNVPGGMMGPNGALRVQNLTSVANTAGTKALALKHNGIQFSAPLAPSSVLSARSQSILQNRGSQSSQVSAPATSTIGAAFINGGSTVSCYYGAVDTSIDRAVTLSGTLAVATDFLVCEAFLAEILPG